MAEQATDSLHLVPRALAEPTEPVTKTWIGSLGLASLVMWMAVDHAAAGRHPRAAAAHRPARQDPRARPDLGVRRGRLAARHPDRRGVLRSHHACLRRRAPARAPAPLDARHGGAERDLPGADGVAAERGRRRRALGPVQRLPERRVRQPERCRARPRAGEPARHRRRVDRHAAGARRSGRHCPGRLRLHPVCRRLPGRWPSRWCCSRCRSCSSRPTIRSSPSTARR